MENHSVCQCWCGNSDLNYFSPYYSKCSVCQTLISKMGSPFNGHKIIDDQIEFYGREYWFTHQEKDLGFPNIVDRARSDLSERCLYWLRTILRYKIPPARILELGCSHGGLVALLRLAGFEASGLELSPWVVDFARRTFDIPMYSGSIENQQIEPGSLDMIALFDVLEHISDPVITLTNCLKLLKPQGTLLIQTPKYPENMTYDQMLARDDIFLDQLKANEHLYLYSIRSIREIFHRIGIDYLKFETAFFDQYDMFFIASRLPHSCYDSIEIEKSLKCYSNGMIILALLDLFENINKLKKEYSQIEFDRADRYKQIVKLTDLLKESETDRSARYEQIVELTNLLKESETDRSARYEQIVKLTNLLKESETDRSARYEQNIKLTNLLKNYEIDLADKVKQITLLEGSLKNNDMNRYIQKQHLISMKSLLKKIERYPEIKWRRKLSKLIRK